MQRKAVLALTAAVVAVAAGQAVMVLAHLTLPTDRRV